MSGFINNCCIHHVCSIIIKIIIWINVKKEFVSSIYLLISVCGTTPDKLDKNSLQKYLRQNLRLFLRQFS